MSRWQNKNDYADAISEIFKILGDPTRLRAMLACLGEERSVGQIAETAELSLPLTSHHLRLLKAAGLVKGNRQGKYVFYHVSDPHIAHMLKDMMEHATVCLAVNQSESTASRTARQRKK